MAGAGTPLRLKDLLELDCDSCSAAGFRCYPRRLVSASSPMRHLLESPEALRGFGGRSPSLRRGPSKLSHLSRSLSRRLRGGFWRRRDEEVAVAVLSVCGCGSEPETSSESSDNSSGRRRSRTESDSDFSSASSASESMHDAVAAAGDEHEAMKRGSKEEGSSSGSEVDDKDEQLSPVAVMDFPFHDDGDGEDEYGDGEDKGGAGACSSSSDDSLARLQRRKAHKIRRFGNLDELGPVDLEAHLAATSDDLADDVPEQQQLQCRTDAVTPPSPGSGRRGVGFHEEPDEHGFLALVMDTVSAGVDVVSERLLLDFFVDMKLRRSDAELPAPAGLLPRKAEWLGDGEIMAAARGWLECAETERWGLNDVLRGGEAVVAEMERGRRWMQCGEEEREIGTVVAGMLIDEVVDELARQIAWASGVVEVTDTAPKNTKRFLCEEVSNASSSTTSYLCAQL
ncbi:uncharacterized protein LOC133907871 [Phragmites australis]|uniref:uncharacterized protein LOC133907871 n=1 Tax=Phragmites australis TaxID=29695 RepID=UPI002D796ACB|nr:uncharacterized protein LOC133907871 [Phragmites australis]